MYNTVLFGMDKDLVTALDVSVVVSVVVSIVVVPDG